MPVSKTVSLNRFNCPAAVSLIVNSNNRRKKTVILSSGVKWRHGHLWTASRAGDTYSSRSACRITLLNKDIEEGVTLHWHGLDVPNAEDGVSGLTQNAVMPGQTHITIRAEQVGHSGITLIKIQRSRLKIGLSGALIVEPKDETKDVGTDIIAMAHNWDSQTAAVAALDSNTLWIEEAIQPNTLVKLRLI